ncbi:MAG: hypothetical protein ACI4XM_02955 [Candidatus Coprovivens sp.]
MPELKEELIKEFPYFEKLLSSAIPVTEELFNFYKNDTKIQVDNSNISVQLLKDIISNEYYYEMAKKLFRDEMEDLNIYLIKYGDIFGSIQLSKSSIIEGLDTIMNQGLSSFDELAYRRYDELKQSISYDRFLEKNRNNNYNITIEETKYSIPIEQIISFLNLSNEEFDQICKSNEIKEINGIPKEHFVYAITKFFKEYKLLKSFQFPQSIIDKINAIDSLQKLDIEAVDKITIISDPNIDKIEVNEELKNTILENLPTDASELEKAIFIYIKMCKLLTYDDEFYAVNQMGQVARIHENINHVKEITPTNNKVVCYEFNAIYGKTLQEIGLTFSTDQALINGFGGGHANLKFRSSKFLVAADSVTSILLGDITKAKLNQPLVGLKCVNKNQQTQQEFNNALTKMYNLIINKENEKSVETSPSTEVTIPQETLPEEQVPTESFAETVAKYKRTTKQIVHISLAEKLDILMQKVNDSKLVGIDSLSYILHLRKVLFTEEERKENINISVIRDNELLEQTQSATASAIIAINESSFTNNPESTIYYVYHPKISFQKITLEELKNKFSNGTYDYIQKKDPEIPGISQGGMKK